MLTHPRHRPRRADRQGPARPDRLAAQGRQDAGAAGDRQRDHHEQPRGPPHGRARRRAPRGGHGHAAHGQGRGHRLDLRPARPTTTPRSPSSRSSAPSGSSRWARTSSSCSTRSPGWAAPTTSRPRRPAASCPVVSTPRAVPAEAVLRGGAQHRERRLAHDPRHRARRDRLQDGRGHLRGVQGHREHGAAALPLARGQARSSRRWTSTPRAPAARRSSSRPTSSRSCGSCAACSRRSTSSRPSSCCSASCGRPQTNTEFLLQVQKTHAGRHPADRTTDVDHDRRARRRASAGDFGPADVLADCPAGLRFTCATRRARPGDEPQRRIPVKKDIHPEYVATTVDVHLRQHVQDHAPPQTSGADPRRRVQRLPPVLHGQAEDPRHRWPRGPLRGALRQEAAPPSSDPERRRSRCRRALQAGRARAPALSSFPRRRGAHAARTPAP